jgi:hypothetical protein
MPDPEPKLMLKLDPDPIKILRIHNTAEKDL